MKAHWTDRLSGKPRVYAIDYLNGPGLDNPDWEAQWAKFPLNIVFSDMQAPIVEHRNRVRALNPELVEIAYIAVNHAQPPTQICGRAESDMAASNPFVRFSDGSIPMDPSGADPAYSKLYDYRSDAWRVLFLESIRESLYLYPYDGIFLDNCNVWDVAIEGNSPILRREMQEALQEALEVVRNRYPRILLIGNSDLKLPFLNGEMAEDRPAAFRSNLVPFPGHVQPEMNLCQLYSTTEINCHNAFKMVNANGGWFGAQEQAFSPQWFDWYLT
jgi:hypothetical protein